MAYFDKYGVRYSDDKKTLEWCPEKFEGEYIIPNDVISIEFGAFSSCIGLKSIMVPNTVKKIGEQAFYNCTSLTKIDLPNSIIEIGESAFEGCSGLTSIDIPNSVTRIGKCAFEGCTALTSVEIPNSVTNIDVGAFAGCAGLTSLEIPNSVTCINDSAFSGCSSLTSVTIPDSVETIGFCAFAGCSSLTSIEIPNSVTNIKESAFNGCISLSAPVYNKHVFAYMPISFSGAYVIPEGINLIAGSAFQKCIGLTSLEIPNSVTSIGDYAFAYCSGLTSIKIPNSVTEIGSAAFFNLTSIQEICIPKGQKARFLQMGLKEYEDIIVERDNEELTVLFNLGKAYELGIGVTQSSAQAILYYIQAAEKGSNEAAFHLGEWYRDGKKVPRDEQKALTYFLQAAKSGFAKAAEQVSAIEQSIAIQKEEEEAKKRQEGIEQLKRQELEQERQRQKVEQEKPYYLFFDTETAGLPPKGKYDVPVTNPDFWPRLVQIAWILTDKEGNVLNRKSKIIYPNGFSIPASATAIHHITTEYAMQVGEPLRDVLGEFMRDLLKAEKIVCHNVEFDQHIVGAELYSMDMDYKALMNRPSICTKLVSTNFCALPNTNGHSGYKWPSLPELYQILFGRDFENAHDALADITATKDCFFELKRRGIIRE